MKKSFTIFIALILISIFILPMEAMSANEGTKGLENAIKKAKSILDIKDDSDYDIFNYSIDSQGNKTIYSLSWEDSKNKLGSIYVNIDSNGRILNYHSYKPFDENTKQPSLPKITKEEALKASNQFIQKVTPWLSNKIKLAENNMPISVGDYYFNFNYYRIENGIPFMQNNINITVNNRTGNISDFNCNWDDDLSFPDTKNVISQDKAEDHYSKKLGLKLVYKLNVDRENSKPYLVYTNVYEGKYIDAKTGEIVKGSIYGPYFGGQSMAKEDAAKGEANTAASVNLSPKEKKAVEESSTFINEAKAEEIARKALNIDKSYKLNSINLYGVWMNKSDYSWNMNFLKDGHTGNISISIDAKTGEVLNFYKFTDSNTNNPIKYNKNKALNIAKDYVNKIQPLKYKEVEYTEWSNQEIYPLDSNEKPRQYSFMFTRKANGAYFIDNGFNITVDAASGSLISYNYIWYKGSLPSTNNIISISKANSILFGEIGLLKQYIGIYNQNSQAKIVPPIPQNGKQAVKLVYGINQKKAVNIDATSGKLLDYFGAPYDEVSVPSYTDIGSSNIKDIINLLAQYGISLSGDKFKPDENISQADFLYLVAKTFNYYENTRTSDKANKQDQLYEYLINKGIVKKDEKSPSSNVSKQDAAKFLVRALGYDSVATIKGIYTLPFIDKDKIDTELIGHISIAYGLNIIKDNNGYINPKDNITRSQSILFIYNILNMK